MANQPNLTPPNPGDAALSQKAIASGLASPAPHLLSPSMSLRGISDRDGIAYGRAFILENTTLPVIEKEAIDSNRIEELVPSEKEKLAEAISRVEKDLGEIIAEATVMDAKTRTFIGAIKAIQALLGDVHKKADGIIEHEHLTAVSAVDEYMTLTIEQFRQSPFLSRNVQDLNDLRERVLRALLNLPKPLTLADAPKDCILLAHDLSVTQTLSGFDPGRIRGIATEIGGVTSHSVMFASKHEIPILVGIPGLLNHARNGDLVVINELEQTLFINPSESVFAEAREKLRVNKKYHREKILENGIAITKDGFMVHILANIEEVESAARIATQQFAGIGLCRSEGIFLASRDPLSEGEQAAKFMGVILSQGLRPVTIRTIDFGSDKIADWLKPFIEDLKEDNPDLGLRGTRLIHREDFRTQIFHPHAAAIIRAFSLAAETNPERDRPGVNRVMFPMINDYEELVPAIAVFRQEMARLEQEGNYVLKHLEFGTMVETPAACLQINHIFADENVGSFGSIGTNDLTGYALAVDRKNSWQGHLYAPHSPGVLKLMFYAVREAKRTGRPLSVCGRMASQVGYLPLLIGLGIDNLSVEPLRAPIINYWIHQLDQKKCKKLVQDIMRKARGPQQSQKMLSEFRAEHMKIDDSASV